MMSGVRLPSFARCLPLLLLLLASAAAAQGPTDVRDEGALAAFFDAAVPPLLSEHEVPGAAVAVVGDGRVLLARGYGAARLEPTSAATPDTPFATGSVAKLFVWTSVMQLAERGELDLDADVNDYLDFDIPVTFDAPITLRHLMTHTAGFEDGPLIGLFSYDPTRLPTLGEALRRELPARVRPPGEESAYSNYGSALAGYIVERVSGTPYDAYVETRILEPLGMTGSSLRRDLPPALAETAAVGYRATGDGAFEPHGRVHMGLYPAGAMVMSVADAARFMLALLGDGSVDGGRILQPATVLQMRQTLFQHDPELPGNAYGFWESAAHGEHILQHGGDIVWFHTQLTLLPDRGLGFYLATNAAGGTALRTALQEAFLDRFFPVPAVAASAASAPLTAYAGSYGSNRASATRAGKVASLFQTLLVRPDGDGLVTTFGEERRWVPLGDGVFADTEREGARLVFRDVAGRATVYVSESPMVVFRALRWFERPRVHLIVLLGATLLLLSGLVGLPLGAWRARRRGTERVVAAERSRWLAVLTAGLLVAGGVLFGVAMADPMRPAFGAPPLMIAALAVGTLAAVAVAALTLMTLLTWFLGWWGPATRVHVTLVTLAGLALVWQMNFWNLLGFRI